VKILLDDNIQKKQIILFEKISQRYDSHPIFADISGKIKFAMNLPSIREEMKRSRQNRNRIIQNLLQRFTTVSLFSLFVNFFNNPNSISESEPYLFQLAMSYIDVGIRIPGQHLTSLVNFMANSFVFYITMTQDWQYTLSTPAYIGMFEQLLGGLRGDVISNDEVYRFTLMIAHVVINSNLQPTDILSFLPQMNIQTPEVITRSIRYLEQYLPRNRNINIDQIDQYVNMAVRQAIYRGVQYSLKKNLLNP
jgi:hypothetical protein